MLKEKMKSQKAMEIITAVKVERSEEHTSELQSPCNLVCRLLLEKKTPRRRRAMSSARDERGRATFLPSLVTGCIQRAPHGARCCACRQHCMGSPACRVSSVPCGS